MHPHQLMSMMRGEGGGCDGIQASAVHEFDETLSKMAERLHRLNARHGYSVC